MHLIVWIQLSVRIEFRYGILLADVQITVQANYMHVARRPANYEGLEVPGRSGGGILGGQGRID
jgi:hypothetical protein